MRLPDDTQRIAIIGRTGSGKTQAGVWQLSLRSFPKKPWTIFDFKGDKLLAEIGAQEVSIHKKPPSKPGLYIVRPMPHEIDAVERYLWEVWAQENHGVYIDEGYMIGRNSPPFRALLTQGRSKNIPLIILSQRPVYMDRFVFSEADFYQVFALNDKRDKQTVEAFLPPNLAWPVHKYHSLYYDVGADKLTMVQPVPSRETIIQTFRKRMPRETKGEVIL